MRPFLPLASILCVISFEAAIAADDRAMCAGATGDDAIDACSCLLAAARPARVEPNAAAV